MTTTAFRNKNNNVELSDPETRIECLFAKCRCSAAAASAATASLVLLPPPHVDD